MSAATPGADASVAIIETLVRPADGVAEDDGRIPGKMAREQGEGFSELPWARA